MTIISISLSDESIRSLERIKEGLDLAGRSEAVRASIRFAESEIKELEELGSDVEGVLILVHSTHSDQWVGMFQHRYEEMIKTQLHSHLQNRKCLEVMIISGTPSMFGDMMKEVHRIGKADYVKFVRSR